MANFSKLIEKKADAAQYMVDEITHICKDMVSFQINKE